MLFKLKVWFYHNILRRPMPADNWKLHTREEYQKMLGSKKVRSLDVGASDLIKKSMLESHLMQGNAVRSAAVGDGETKNVAGREFPALLPIEEKEVILDRGLEDIKNDPKGHPLRLDSKASGERKTLEEILRKNND